MSEGLTGAPSGCARHRNMIALLCKAFYLISMVGEIIMAQKPDMDTLSNATVYGSGGDKIGSVGEVYLDNESDRPEWLTVKTGMFGTNETFIPLADAQVKGSDIHVLYDKAKVKDAPNIDADGALNPEEEQELYRYYGLGQKQQSADSGTQTQDTKRRGEQSGPEQAGREQSETAGREHTEGHDT